MESISRQIQDENEIHSVLSDSLQAHGLVLQARILEWVAFSLFQPRSRTEISCIALQVDSLPTELSGKPPNQGLSEAIRKPQDENTFLIQY